MRWFGRKEKPADFRLFFATDVHGSTPTFRKFVNAANFYKVHALVLGGDITGKMLVPVLREAGGRFSATLQERPYVLENEEEVAAFAKHVAKMGFYTAIVTPEEYARLAEDAEARERLYREQARERLREWIRFAEERLGGTDVLCYITGGNDDPPEILALLQEEAREHVVPCEGRAVELAGGAYPMVSLGYSNPTPWQTPREVEEETMAQLIAKAVEGVQDFSRAIFNFHAPPVDSTLDTCPLLDNSTDPPTVVTSGGQPVLYGAGSRAVREAIERFQPLLSLHGHIHESRGLIQIGRTTAVNPGSEYGEGILRGAIVTLSGDRVRSVQLTSG
ncbi:MAG: metallophosphoesterase family protein [Chloroflexia bacterium]